MSKIFIIHAHEDADLALEIAAALDTACYATWCYELDTVPGVEYTRQTREAIAVAPAVVVIISPRAIGSRQVDVELVSAFERKKRFIPVLRQMNHVQLQTEAADWAHMFGAATSICVPEESSADKDLQCIPEGLAALRILPATSPVPGRRERIQKELRKLRDQPTQSRPKDIDPRPTVPEPPAPRVPVRWGVILSVSVTLLLVATLALRGLLPQPRSEETTASPTNGAARKPPEVSRPDGPLILGVMDIHPMGDVPEWMLDFTRDGLNTVLSKAPGNVRVYSREKIDLVRRKRQLSEIEAAEHLGIVKMISGSISVKGGKAILRVKIVDIGSGLLEDSESVEGSEDELIQMQNRAAEKMVRAMNVTLKPDDVTRMFSRTDDALDSYKLLQETMGPGVPDEGKPVEQSPPAKRGALRFDWPAKAWAEDSDEAAVRALLERYRTALESKDLKQLASVQDVNDAQLQALSKYFDTASGLKVKFSDIDILLEGDEGVATFTRDDVFEDKPSGRDRHLEIRVSSVLVKDGNVWKIRGFKKPS